MKYLEIPIEVATRGKSEYIAHLTSYIPDVIEGVNDHRKRPAVLVLPGGGYNHTSKREGEPIALELASRGICAFVLHYSVAPARYPQALCEALKAMAYIRKHAEEWLIDKDCIGVCGFSAGGHLAASVGIFWNSDIVNEYIDEEKSLLKPNVLLLSYPVITSGEYSHKGSFEDLFGENKTDELMKLVSLENQVSEDVPPCFIWHTYEDGSVPVQNTLLFANQLITHNIPTEVHIYRRGGHGLSLGNYLVDGSRSYLDKHESSEWIDHAVRFILDL